MRLSFIFSVAMWSFLSAFGFGQTTVMEGEVSGVWDLAGSPYLIEGNLTLPDSDSLTIEPGVVVEFQGYYSLQVQGCLTAIGNETDTILFTVHDTTGFSDPDTLLGAWNGIRFTDTPVENDTSRLIHCCLEFSKAVGPVWHLNAGGAISMLQFGKVVIADCLLRNNSAGGRTDHPPIGGGIYLFKSDAVIRNTIFLNNRARYGGAVYMDESSPVFKENFFMANQATEGGAVSMGGTCRPTFRGDQLIRNRAEVRGGGLIFGEPSEVICSHVSFMKNRADWGGGIGVLGGTLRANDCDFSENYVKNWGGGIAGDFATMQIKDCRFTSDSSAWGSGAIHMDHTEAEIQNCTFEENSAFFGGGFHAVFSQVSVLNSQFLKNRGQSAGAAHLESSDCVLQSCHFQENAAINGPGGAVEYLVDTTLFSRPLICTITGCTFTDNSAFQHSGAMRIHQSTNGASLADIRVDSCLFLHNHSDVYGSFRINGFLDDFLVSRCIFQGNTATRYVAGAGFIGNSHGRVENCLFNANYTNYSDTTRTLHGASLGSQAEVTFANCTFSDTSSVGGTGLSMRRGSKAAVFNTIFWGCGYRPVSVVTAADLGSTLFLEHCCLENGKDSVFVSDSLSTLIWAEGNLSEDPQFVNLKGGDFHLMDTSPCIGAGINQLLLEDTMLMAPVHDLEGNPRPSPQGSMTDLGALEHVRGFPVGLAQEFLTAPLGCRLYPNIPNPFVHSTRIRYELSCPSHVELCIYNLFGQKVAVLVAADKTAGTYSVDWEGSGYEAGYFICRLETEKGESQTIKLLKTR